MPPPAPGKTFCPNFIEELNPLNVDVPFHITDRTLDLRPPFMMEKAIEPQDKGKAPVVACLEASIGPDLSLVVYVTDSITLPYATDSTKEAILGFHVNDAEKCLKDCQQWT